MQPFTQPLCQKTQAFTTLHCNKSQMKCICPSVYMTQATASTDIGSSCQAKVLANLSSHVIGSWLNCHKKNMPRLWQT